MFALVIPALLAGVLFSGSHAYVGLRLLDRGAILAALAITEFAALGTAVAVLTGHDLQSYATDAWSLGFGLVGAAALQRIRARRETAGAIAFVLAAAAAMLVLNFAPQETDHIRVMLAGNMAAVALHTLLHVGIVYAGAVFVLARSDSETLLYLMTGVITGLSTPIAGVLLVFAYLIIPPVAAMLFTRSIGKRLAIGWTMGALATALGVLLSFKIDLPTGATVVCTFGLTLLLMTGVWAVWRRASARRETG